jgi:hypothetical protein
MEPKRAADHVRASHNALADDACRVKIACAGNSRPDVRLTRLFMVINR